jgi:hypothetical protein
MFSCYFEFKFFFLIDHRRVLISLAYLTVSGEYNEISRRNYSADYRVDCLVPGSEYD